MVEMMRTSGRDAPGVRIPVSALRSARNRRACRSTDRAPMLSSNTVPPCADSSPMASVVRTCFSGTAAQSTLTKGPSARPESACTARAIRSLPVPCSPPINTGEVEAAIRGSALNSARMRVLAPIMP